MYETFVETTAELGAVVARALGALGAAIAGFLLEVNGIQTLGTGEQVVGLWMAALGGVLLFVGYVLAGDAVRAFGRRAAN